MCVEGMFLNGGVSWVGLAGGYALLLMITGQNTAGRFKCGVFWMFAKGVEEFSAGVQLELPSILVLRGVSFGVVFQGFKD